MILADRIRQHVITTYIVPARKSNQSQVIFVSGDVHDALGLTMRYPAVCGAIDAKKFRDENRLHLLRRTGPDQGATTEWTFAV